MNAPLNPSARAVMAQAAAAAVRPRERLLVSQWADRHRILTSKQSGEAGKWRTSRNPMLREIMDALSVHSTVREIVVMKSSQVGVTEMSVNWLGYIINHAPASAMVLMPTIEARDTWKAQKLNPLLMDTPAVSDILGGIRSRDAANSKDMIDFPGGILFLAGGNSPNSYAQKSVRFLMLDDLDRFPHRVGEEGDPVGLARARVKAFPRYKLLLASTPTIKGASLIEREFEASDQRHFHVPCPHCGELLVLNWKHVQANAALTEAWYVCTECSATIHEHDKPKLLAAGVWIAEHPEIERRGYHISALYAPIGLARLGWIWCANFARYAKTRLRSSRLSTDILAKAGKIKPTSSKPTNWPSVPNPTPSARYRPAASPSPSASIHKIRGWRCRCWAGARRVNIG